MIATAPVPEESPALVQAYGELETLSNALVARRAALNKAAMEELTGRISEAFRTAQKPEEVDTLIAVAETAGQALSRRFARDGTNDLQHFFPQGESLLRGLKRFLETPLDGDCGDVKAAVEQLRGLGETAGVWAPSVSGEIKARVAQILKPRAEELDKTQEELDAALLARKPLAETQVLMARFEELADLVGSLRTSFGANPGAELRKAVEAYRLLVNIIVSLETGDGTGVQQRFSEARQAARKLGAKNGARFEAMLVKWEGDWAERRVRQVQERQTALRQQLAAAKTPAAVEELAATVAGWAREGSRRNEPEGENYAQLGRTLSTLAAVWSSASIHLLPRAGQGAEEMRPAYAKELRALQTRIERDVMSKVLEAPELRQPPLAEMEPEAAIHQLAAGFTRRGEWRRLLRYAELRNTGREGQPFQQQNDLLMALRSFFAGQNFELAELWAEAAQAYKSVLTSSSEMAPITAAAERLKVLTKEHPEALASPAARPPFPR